MNALDAIGFRCDQCEKALEVGPDKEPVPCLTCYRQARHQDAARRRKLGNVVAGVDLDKALATYREYPPFKDGLGRRQITLKVAHSIYGGVGGKAYVRERQIRLNAGPLATRAEALETLVHEMAHLACPLTEYHGERFRRVLRRALLEIWGIDVPIDVEPLGPRRIIAYRMDEIAIAELKAKVDQGTVEIFPPSPKSEIPRRSRAEAMEKIVEKRATHALRMHKRAATRLKRAKTLEEKWRKKVRYYERQAAKRRT